MVIRDPYGLINTYLVYNRGRFEIENVDGEIVLRVEERGVKYRGKGATLIEAIKNALEDGWAPEGRQLPR